MQGESSEQLCGRELAGYIPLSWEMETREKELAQKGEPGLQDNRVAKSLGGRPSCLGASALVREATVHLAGDGTPLENQTLPSLSWPSLPAHLSLDPASDSGPGVTCWLHLLASRSAQGVRGWRCQLASCPTVHAGSGSTGSGRGAPPSAAAISRLGPQGDATGSVVAHEA